MKKQIAIYVRQSVDKKESLSIESQIELCGIGLASPVIYQDKGYSGKNTERPALKSMIEDINSGKIEKVIVYKLDRISRNISDFYKLYEIMDAASCSFVSVSESFDTSNAMGRAMMGILAVFAQMERENIQKRVKDNYYFRTAQTGCWAGGPAPYGFKNGRNELNQPTLHHIDAEIENIAYMIANYYGADTMTLGQIASQLNQKGYRTRNGRMFTSSTVAKILQNPIYFRADKLLYDYFKMRKIKFLNDEVAWDGTHSAHVIGKRVGNSNIRKYTDLTDQSVYLTNFPGMFPSALYIQIQEQLERNERFGRANSGGVLKELSGILKCSVCGYAIKSFSKSTTGRPYLSCYGNTSLHLCSAKYNKLNFYELQKTIGDEIQNQIHNMENLRQNKIDSNKAISAQINDLKNDISKLLDLSLKSDLAADAVIGAIEQKQDEINRLELQFQMNKHSVALTSAYFASNIDIALDSNTPVVYDSLTLEQKKKIVGLLVKRINLTPDINKFEIIWKI